MIRRGNCDPVAVEGPLPPSPAGGYPGDLCLDVGGDDELKAGLFQRAAVLPDGSGVVFEVTNEVSVSRSVRDLVLPERGFYFVRADGTHLRRLADPSRAPSLAFIGGAPSTELFVMAVSPDGKTIAFTDLGPGPDGRETDQVFALDLASGDRTQLTHRGATDDAIPPRLSCVTFLDDRTITFCNRAYTPELGIFRITEVLTVPIDGHRPEQLVPVVPVPGGGVVPRFGITGSKRKTAVTVVFYPAMPTDHLYIHPPVIEELFLLEAKSILQLTDFHRSDTARTGTGGTLAGQRVFFEASANPFGPNPDQYCQIFSVDAFGAGLRQLTHLRDRDQPSRTGCFDPLPGSCSINRYFADRLTGTIVFTSNCDAVGGSAGAGWAAFSMRPDGSGLRQLSSTPDRASVHWELPDRFEYP